MRTKDYRIHQQDKHVQRRKNIFIVHTFESKKWKNGEYIILNNADNIPVKISSCFPKLTANYFDYKPDKFDKKLSHKIARQYQKQLDFKVPYNKFLVRMDVFPTMQNPTAKLPVVKKCQRKKEKREKQKYINEFNDWLSCYIECINESCEDAQSKMNYDSFIQYLKEILNCQINDIELWGNYIITDKQFELYKKLAKNVNWKKIYEEFEQLYK